MDNTYLMLLAAFLSAALLTSVGLPLIVRACRTLGYYDMPDVRKVHQIPVPRLGGLVFMPAAMLGLIVASVVFFITKGEKFSFGISTLAMAVGGMMVYVIGVLDDRYGIKASWKFVIQCIAALVMPLCNLLITDLGGLFGLHEIPFLLGYVLTVVLIITIVNAINLIDGIDGLASGLCILILSAYAVLFYRAQMLVIASLCVAVVGSLVMFWLYNVFGKAGGMKIFMGDAGSLFLGYVCAYMGIKSMMRPIAPVDCGEEQMLISFSLLLIPVLDVVRVTLQRMLTGHGIFVADKIHIHHMLMRAGLSMHGALASILSLFVLICIINYALWQCSFGLTLIVLTDVALYGLVCALGSLTPGR